MCQIAGLHAVQLAGQVQRAAGEDAGSILATLCIVQLQLFHQSAFRFLLLYWELSCSGMALPLLGILQPSLTSSCETSCSCSADSVPGQLETDMLLQHVIEDDAVARMLPGMPWHAVL
jgi:hypothetical protein